MTVKSFPFNTAQVQQSDWQLWMPNVIPDGVFYSHLNKLAVFADSTGMHVKVQSGGASVRGTFYQDDGSPQTVVPIANADASNARYDVVVLRLNPSTNSIGVSPNDVPSNSIKAVVVQGTPANPPTRPALTQTVGGTWDIPLAQVTVGAGVATIAASNVADLRQMIKVTPIHEYHRAYHSADQTVSNATDTRLSFDTDFFTTDAGQRVDSSHFWCKSPGVYLVGANIRWGAGSTLGQRRLSILANGVPTAETVQPPTSGGGGMASQQCQAMVSLVGGDTVEVHAYQDSGSSQNVGHANFFDPVFWMVQVA